MCQEEKEKKKSDQLERKKESQRLADEELESITLGPGSVGAGGSAAGGSGSKVTRAEIEAHQLKQLHASSDAAAAASSNVVVVDESPLEENINRLTVDGLEARSVDEAIRILRSVLTHTSLLLMMSLYIVYIGEWRVTMCLCLQLPCTCIAHHVAFTVHQ